MIASRLGPALSHIVDSTQTGFLPERWIGDNILAHLEEIDYCQQTQQPGVLVFLDFEKAFDRLNRPWIQQCMAAVGFAARAQQWVSILHAGSSGKLPVNGWHTQRFPVQSGVRASSAAHDSTCQAACSSAGVESHHLARWAASTLSALPCR